MITPKVSTTEKGFAEYKKITDELRKMQNAYVTIGVHEDAGQYQGSDAPSVVEVALWNEFGTKTVPERSFFRSAIDEHGSKINQLREKAIRNITEGKSTCRQELTTIGEMIQGWIQNKMKSDIEPAYGTGKSGTKSAKEIAAAQAAKKKQGYAPVTLIASTLLYRSITFKVFVND